MNRKGGNMPIWTVEGADKDTGRDVVRSIEAPTEELARAKSGVGAKSVPPLEAL
jgi:hypothetical protein